MTQRFKLEGIYTPLITPFANDGSIDYKVLAQLIENLIAAGVHGLISGGSTGENYAETVEERLEIARFVVKAVNGRLPVFIGTGAMRTPDSVALAAGAKAMGADGLLLGTPPYSVPTERENAINALTIDRAANLPIILYNYPGRMGVEMGRDFLDRVGRSRNVIGIKESSGDINRLHLLARDYPHIQLSCGMDDQALECAALQDLRARRRLREGPPHHVGHASADARAGAGGQVHPVREARSGDHGAGLWSCAPAAQRPEQGRETRAGTGDPHA